MSNLLERIFAGKAHVRARDEARESYDEVRARGLARRSERRPFADTVRSAAGPAIIGEIKRASPSVGLIARDFDPEAIARKYDAAGVDAISVLTETDHFLGELAYLDLVRAQVAKPLLRKDFLRTRYEIAQSAAYGADAILLIVAVLSDDELRAAAAEAADYELDVLIEVHDLKELERALTVVQGEVNSTLIGINNRDLRTFEIDLSVTEHLLPGISAGITVISESGMHDSGDITRLYRRGVRGFLIGEALMRSDDPQAMLAELRQSLAESAVR